MELIDDDEYLDLINVAITLSQTEFGGIEKILSIQFEGHQCSQERRVSNILIEQW